MRRWLLLVVLVAASFAALYYSRLHKTETRVGPEAVLNALADTQREISRLPAGLARLSDGEEVRIGDTMAQNYLARIGALPPAEAQMQDYVNVVGRTVASHRRRALDYKFHYMPDAHLVNAFALPGGHIFIGKGLILLMASEDELASVLGHEVEHVENFHCNERVALQARLRHVPLGGLVTLPVELFEAGYSKEQEMEADRDGITLAVEAGYSPEGAVHLLQTFARLQPGHVNVAYSPDQELSKVALEGIAGYFRSHPLPAEREAQVRQMERSQHWPQPPLRALRVRLEPLQRANAKP
jgi:predicted Zn-dependent protease